MSAAAGSIGGGILGGLLDFPIQKSFNVKQTRHARKWQEYMASTAYQRTVKDLEAAGINPLYAVTGGSPYGVPQTQVAASPDLDLASDVARGKSVGTAAAKQIQLMNATVGKAKSDAVTAGNMAKASEYEPVARQNLANESFARYFNYLDSSELLQEQRRNTAIQSGNALIQRKLLESQIPGAQEEAQLYKDYPWLRTIEKGVDVLSPFK